MRNACTYKWGHGAKGYYQARSRPESGTNEELASFRWWSEGHDLDTISIETHIFPTDKYEIKHFARESPERFFELTDCMSPRDAEILICFALLQKTLTDLSILFGKRGHWAFKDLHKAAHKLAGLIEFGPEPDMARIDAILHRHNLHDFAKHSLAACMWQYSRTRDFHEMARLIGDRGLRLHMMRTFKTLHAMNGRDEGLLAGWILWLVDGSNPYGKGWRKRKRSGYFKIGPTVFRTFKPTLTPRADGRGGQGQRPDTVKITRKIKFLLKGN